MFNTTNSGYSLADIAAATGSNNRNYDDGFMGGNSAWWIIILFLFCFAGGWNNGGLFGGSSTGSGITDGYILTSDFANIERKLDSVNNGICDGFYAMNTGMLNGFNATQNSIQTAQAGITAAINNNTVEAMQNTNAIGVQLTSLGTQMADCCCNLRFQSATQASDLNYRLAEQSCQTRQAIADATTAITANQDANTRSILDFLTQDKIATLTAENQSLKFAASQEAQNNYLISQLGQKAAIPAYIVQSPYANYGYNGCGCNCGVNS